MSLLLSSYSFNNFDCVKLNVRIYRTNCWKFRPYPTTQPSSSSTVQPMLRYTKKIKSLKASDMNSCHYLPRVSVFR